MKRRYHTTRQAAERLGMSESNLQRRIWEQNKANPAEEIKADKVVKVRGLTAWRWTDAGIERLRNFLKANPRPGRGRPRKV